MYITSIQFGGIIGIVCIITFFVVRVFQQNKKLKQQLQSALFLHKKLESAIAELDEQKTEFVSIASHQLRTPLAIIRGYMELLESGAYGDASQDINLVLKDVNTANERLIELVDSLLHIAEIDQGRLHLQFQNTNLIQIIQSVYYELLPVAEKKKITLVWNGEVSSINLYIDEEKIRMVLFNLLENAIKYSDEGNVHIHIDHNPDAIVISIEDEGRGFSIEESDYIFQKFYRSAGARNMDISGSGLGLYIAKQIVEAHNGTIQVESKGIGNGSRFLINLPLERGYNAVYDMYSE